jgi:hypothetical protein
MAGRNWKYRAKLRAGWEMGRVGNVPGLSGKWAKREVGSVGSGLLAGSVADVHMPTAPGWQTPLREVTNSLAPTLSEATCRAIGDPGLQVQVVQPRQLELTRQNSQDRRWLT